jgi:dihydrofolate reductase
MKLTTVTNVSLDGVTQGHRRIDVGTRREGGGPEEDGSDGFERFGWGPPLLDDEASTFISQTFQRADAFLLGRQTYEIFAGSWGAGMDPGNPVGEALNTRHKYVASTTLKDPQWAHTTVLSGDIASAIGELRAEPGGELQVWGSGLRAPRRTTLSALSRPSAGARRSSAQQSHDGSSTSSSHRPRPTRSRS